MQRARFVVLWATVFIAAGPGSAQQRVTQVVGLEEFEGRGAPGGVHWLSASLWTSEEGGLEVWAEDLGERRIGTGREGALLLELGRSNPLPADAAELWLQLEADAQPLGPREHLGPSGEVVIDGSLGISFGITFGDEIPNTAAIRFFSPDLDLINFGGGEISLWTSPAPGDAAGKSLVVQPNGRVHAFRGTDAEFTDGSGYLMIGAESSNNLLLDDNELMARNDGAASTLFLQNSGGAVFVNGVQVHASDARLKRDVRELEVGLGEVLALRPVSYAWKKGDGRRHYGLIAQEVEQLSESLILENEEGYKGVAYMELVPLLIRALQEQEERIRRLEAEVAASDG